MSPWLSWYGALDSAVRSRATPLAEAAAKLWTQPDRMLENLRPLSDSFREMAGLPELADLPDMGLKSLPSAEPAMELMAVLQQYLRVATPIWIEACQKFESEASRRRKEGESFDSASEALELWNNTLDRTLDGIQSLLRISPSCSSAIFARPSVKDGNASLFRAIGEGGGRADTSGARRHLPPPARASP